jgi:integrase
MMKGVYARGRSFQVKKKFAGHGMVTGTFATQAEAEAFVVACDLAIRQGKPLPNPRGEGSTHSKGIRTLKQLWEETAAVKWAGNRTSSSAEAAELFVRWCGPDTPIPDAFTAEKLHEFVKYRISLGNAGRTINAKLSAANMMQKLAFDLKLIPAMAKLPRQKQGKGRLRYYTMEEQRTILDWTRKLGHDKWADYWQFLADTGARMGEARKSRWEDYRGGRVTFEAPDTKTELTRVVPLTDLAMEALKRRKADPELGGLHGPWAWAGKEETRRMWDKLREFIPWLREDDTVPYTFRHTCASRLAMVGNSAPLIKKWMGHTSLSTTERYMHLAPASVDTMIASLEKFKDPTFEKEPAPVS